MNCCTFPAIGSEGRSAPLIRPSRVTRAPVRIQRSRKLRTCPDDAFYVGRGSLFANPFLATRFGHVRSVRLHADWLNYRLGQRRLLRMGFCPSEIDALRRLRIRVLRNIHLLIGMDIQCWCGLKSRWCHGDTLMALVLHRARQLGLIQ